MFIKSKEKYLHELEQDGVTILDQRLDPSLLHKLQTDLEKAEIFCEEKRNKLDSEEAETLRGSAHHILGLEPSFHELLDENIGLESVEKYLGGKLIINNYGGFLNNSKDSSYKHGLSIHRDVRTADQDYGKQMVVLFVLLDNFTEDNGATYLYKGSHKFYSKPSKEEFFKKSTQAICKAGTIVIFDARVWHCAGRNITGEKRRALTIGFTRPFFKPQFNYEKAFKSTEIDKLSENIKQLIGLNAKVPQNHEDWYTTQENRFYKRNQG